MKMKAIAVRDIKTGLFDPPFFLRHTGDAVRQWSIVTKNPETKYGAHPADFDLYCLGEFDDETGMYESISPVLHLANGATDIPKEVRREATRSVRKV